MVSSVKMEDVCAFCRSNHEKSTSQALEGVRLDMLGIVAPNFGVDVQGNNKSSESKNICFDCNENLKYLFDFKTVCLENEDHLLNFKNYETHDKINLANALQKTNFNEDVHCIDSDTDEICRLCFKRAKLEKTSALETVKNMLERCLPEIDLHLTTKTLFCDECLGMLEKHFKFLLQHDMKKELQDSLIASEDVEMSTAPVDKSEISDTNTATESINDLLTNVQRQSDKLLNFCGMTNEEPCSSSQVNELSTTPVATSTNQTPLENNHTSDCNTKTPCDCIICDVTEFTNEKCNCIVCQISSAGFQSLSSTFQKKIILEGRPEPKLGGLYVKNCFQAVNKNVYLTEWLTVCDSLARIFCWPCLLFSDKTDGWNKVGVTDLHNIDRLIEAHTKDESHLHCATRLRIIEIRFKNKSVSCGASTSDDIRLYNLVVKQNHEVLRRLIDFVCYVVINELSITGVSNTVLSNYFNLLTRYETTNFEKASVLSSKSLQSDIINAIQTVTVEHIRREIAEANFVSLLLSDVNVNQISIVLRLIKHNDIQERCLGFLDGKAVETVYPKIVNVMDQMACGGKLISFSYTGVLINDTQLKILEKRIGETYDKAFNIPCFEHKLSTLFENAVNHIPQCKKFFTVFRGLSRFFSKSLKRNARFKAALFKRFPNFKALIWNYRSRLLQIVNEHRTGLIAFFENILASSFSKWDFETITQSRHYLQVLKHDGEFIFLLDVFSETLPLADDVLKSCGGMFAYDITVRISRLSRLKDTFLVLKQDVENRLFMIDSQEPRSKRARLEEAHQKLLDEIFECITKCTQARLDEYQEVTFVEVCNLKKYPFKSIPDSFWEMYGGNFFQVSNLRTALSVISDNECVTQKANAKELLGFLSNYGRDDMLSELKKFCEFILTLPVFRCKNSALERIDNFMEKATIEENVSELVFLIIEKPLLSILYESPMFYTRVIEELAKNENEIKLKYK